MDSSATGAGESMVVLPDLRTVGVVPASGASRRMGRAKAAMQLDGRTFVQRVVDALRDGGCVDVIVVVPPDDAAVMSAAHDTGARVVVNPAPGEGPITSMRLAIEQLHEDVDAIAWLPVDYPLVEGDIVRHLRTSMSTQSVDLALPVHEYFMDGVRREKRGHPAVFSRALFAELADPELDGGARSVVHRHLADAAITTVRDPRVVTDIDTPSDYEAVRSGRAPYSDQPPGSAPRGPA
ncbi:MAG: nucleotidyltransferase family protein [Longimicrobiales bacterium]